MIPLTNEAEKNAISGELVRQIVQKITTDPIFAVSNILKRFLSFIVEETLNGSSNQIKEYTIAVKVLNRPAYFDPKQDGIVRIHACRLRLALSKYYLHSGKNDPIRISVPRGTYVPMFADHGHCGNVEKTSSKARLGRVADQGQPDAPPSVAVLPFYYVDKEISTVTFAEGLASKLNTELSTLKSVDVIAHYSIRCLTKKNPQVKDILRDVGAKYIFTGDIQNCQDFYRVNIQLINAHTGIQVWSHTFDQMRHHNNLYAIQDNIVKQVIASFIAHCGLGRKARTSNRAMAVA
jgi:TolB-like protein